jgi:hypothetical protein
MSVELLNTDGKYGIDALIAVTNAANRGYDLAKAVWVDDPGWQTSDWFDLVNGGPRLAIAITEVIRQSGNILDEATDLSEAEKEALISLAGERVKDARYLKIYNGLLNVLDGIAELRKPDNPTT